MPVNDFGVRADMIIGPEAVFNRMNIGQMYEQFITAMGDYVVRLSRQNEDPIYQYNKILEFCYDVNPQYGIIVEKCTDTDKRRYAYARECIRREQIVVVVPPFLDNLNEKWVLDMYDKYKVPTSPVEYNLRDADGNLIRRVRTLRNVWIGKKYVFILCKIPHARSCGMSYINQLRIPIRCKNKKSKHQWPIGLVPLRIGEDEFRNLKMGVGKMAFRILSLYANSPDATNTLTESLLTASKPTQLQWAPVTEESIAKGNIMIKVGNHMLATAGIDFDDVLLTQEEEQNLQERLTLSGALM